MVQDGWLYTWSVYPCPEPPSGSPVETETLAPAHCSLTLAADLKQNTKYYKILMVKLSTDIFFQTP